MLTIKSQHTREPKEPQYCDICDQELPYHSKDCDYYPSDVQHDQIYEHFRDQDMRRGIAPK